MSDEIIGLHPWFDTPPGQCLLDWERRCFDAAVADLFGFHGVQLGLPLLDGLAANRMRHRWIVAGPDDLPPDGALPHRTQTALVTDFAALPFDTASLDLVLLPHTLERSPDPHATLREVERVLMPEGRAVICGLNPAGLWCLRQRRVRLAQRFGMGRDYLPGALDPIGYWRLRDWLRLLSFEVESGRFGCFRPAVRSQRWLDRHAWMERAGDRWWPFLGAAYFVVATKRVPGMRLIGKRWKAARRAPAVAAPVPIAGRAGGTGAEARFASQDTTTKTKKQTP